MLSKIGFTIVFLFTLHLSFSQRKVTFFSEDSVKITADLYFKGKNDPFIILSHGVGSSRGEYINIADRLTNLGYNCLAIDLRTGDESHFIQNETVNRINKRLLPSQYIHVQKDIAAAIQYGHLKSGLPVVLMGNNFSASLCLMEAMHNPKVRAVAAFSPGEYFGNIKVSEFLKPYDKIVFIGCNSNEKKYVDELTKHIPKTLLFQSSHETSLSISGTELLYEKNPQHDEYWLDLLLFFNSISEN